MKSVADDIELNQDDFWKFVREQFDNWKEEERFDQRITINDKNYKISFLPDSEREDIMYIKILRRTPQPDGN